MKQKLKVAVLSTGKVINTWQHSVLQDIENSLYANLALHIIVENTTSPKIPLTWKLFSHLDNFIFKPRPNALASIENNTFFKNKKVFIDIGDFETYDLNDYQLDVIINFSDLIPTKKIISACKHGIWNLEYSDPHYTKKGPPGAWELILDRPEIGAYLSCIAEGSKYPVILDQTLACTDWISYSRNANIIYWWASSLITRNLKRLFDSSVVNPATNSSIEYSVVENNLRAVFKYPKAGLIIWHSLKTVFNKVFQLLESQIYFNQWILLFNSNPEIPDFNMSQYKRIIPPKDRFWADPFLIKRNGKYFLFIEELIYKNKLGHLAVMEIDEKGNYSIPKIILKKDYHLSYPFLFEDSDNLYMIPETSENKNIQLYKCTNFPYEWTLEKNLMNNVAAVDTTIYKKDNLYWMFTNFKVHKGMSSNVELSLFYSKELTSDHWTPHPLNPIVTDVKTSRPAGKLFIDKDKLIRPSQNCSHHYGYGMNMNMITQLDNTNFKEEIAHSIRPNWGEDVLCTHTFNSCGQIKISDAQIKRRRFF